MDKFRNTALKHRLGKIAVGNYGFNSLARFALSYEISPTKELSWMDKFHNTALKLRLGKIAVGNYGVASFARFALSREISSDK